MGAVKNILSFVIVAFISLVATHHTHATTLIGFDGIVTEVTQPAGVPDPRLFSIGDLLNGSYTFDASTLRANSLATSGIYSYVDADVAFSLGSKIGSSPVAISAYGYNTRGFDPNNNPIERDLFQWFARQEEGLTLSGLGDWYLIDFDIILEDFSNSAVPPGSPGNFLADPVDVSLFPTNRFVLIFCAGSCEVDQFEVRGSIESFYVVPIPVDIDIKPGNMRNVINPRTKGDIWVAILSDTDSGSPFDPSSQVDILSVEFGPNGTKSNQHKVKDINKDGLGDLLLRFNMPQTGITCEDTEVSLSGEVYGGQSFSGTDSIKTVGCKKVKKR